MQDDGTCETSLLRGTDFNQSKEMKRILSLSLMAAVCLLAGSCSGNKSSVRELSEGWDNPPQSARTRVWWHWMNGNITKEGIRKDLEWMDRIGLGGFQNFDAASGTPTIVKDRLVYMHDGWKDAFAYAAHVADSLGLEFAIASAPGWSSTGGPWVEPKDAMKKLVWRTMTVEGGSAVDLTLPSPYKSVGAFQNGTAAGRGAAAQVEEYYEDVAVLAVKMPEGRKTSAQLGAKVSSSGGSFTLEQLSDGDITNSSLLPADTKKGYSWIMYEYPEPVTVKSVTLVDGSTGGFGGRSTPTTFEASGDGKNFSRVSALAPGGVAQRTVSVPATTAKYFRITYRNQAPPAGGGMFGMPMQRGPQGTSIAELDLHTYTMVNRFEDKAGFSALPDLTAQPTPQIDGEKFPSPEDVVDITSKMTSDGKINWDAPQGTWKIYRFGFSLTGKQNHPAPLEATGLEVDKLDPIAWTAYFRKYFDMYKDASGGLMGQRGVQYVLTDSYEAENETWTPAMREEFRSRRGYDMMAWMPVIAGEVIGSPEKSDAFLWDYRATIGDLLAENYDRISQIAIDEYGMKGRYSESHEGGRAYVGDGMDLKRTAEVPMSAMWVTASWLPTLPSGEPDRSMYNADDKESASVAHIYGQNVAAAESMTAPGQGGLAYSYCPENLKFIADIELSNGINRFVIHESAHQPSDEHVPGLSLGGIGQWFNRHDTWAEMAGVWVDYMSRSSYALQWGKNVADILYYYGQDSNVTSVFGNTPPIVPAGYQWDYCSPHALLNAISADKGNLVSQGGTKYKVLWMDRNMDYVSTPVLRKILSLAESGVMIGGVRPSHPASLSDDAGEWSDLVKKIWDSGRANVKENISLADFLKAASVSPDVKMPEGMKFLHRTAKGAEVYWVNKPSRDYSTVEVSFRTSGLKPQVWHPDTGIKEDVSYRVDGDRTVVTLEMVPDDALFVVFSGKGEASHKVETVPEKTLLTVSTPWTVAFQQKRGAPSGNVVFPQLVSYTESEEFGIKYFSGVATYSNTINVPAASGKTFIDLGSVKNIAEVYVNGQYCGTAWKEPFRVDVSSALKEGDNLFEVKVANVWPNRLIGDQQPDCPEQVTFSDSRAYRAGDPLRPAGLLGPVRIIGK